MKNIDLLLLVLLSACAAPVSYINNVPRSSGLEEGGDVNVNVNIGSDLRGRDKVFQFGGAWSPTNNFGLEVEWVELMLLDANPESLEKMRFLRGSMIYYQKFTNQSTLEFKLGIGSGEIQGEIEDSSIPIFSAQDILIDSRYKTLDFQTSYNMYVSSENVKTSIGFRARRVAFDSYAYTRIINDNSGKSFVTENWNVYFLDPFIEVKQEVNETLSFNSSLSFSFLNGTIRDDFRHPFHKRLGLSLGLQIKL